MPNELKAGAVINYVSIVVRLATSFLLTPFVIKCLGVEEYGLFMLSSSVILWLSLTDFGLGGTVNKYVATYHAKGEKEQEAHFLGQSMMLFSALGLLTLLVGVVCFFYLDVFFPDLNARQHEALEIMYLLTLGNLILAFPLRPLGCVPGAYLKFIVPGVVHLAMSLVNAGLTVLLLFWGYRAIGLTVLHVVIAVASLLWGLYYTIRCLGVRIIFRKPDLPLYRELFTFSLWILLNQLMDLFYWRAGTPILASMSGMAAVTIFTIGISFSQYFMTASTAISGVIGPKIMHMVALDASKEELTHMMVRVGRLQVVILVLILCGFAVYGETFLRLWVGSSIGAGTWTAWLGALLVLIPLTLPLTQNMGLALLQAMNIHKGRAIILFYSSVICVVLGVVLSHFYGAIGMFIGTAISLTIGQCIMINIYYHRRAGLNMFTFFRKTFVPLILPVALFLAIGVGMSYFLQVNNWIEFFAQAGCYGALGVLLLFFLYFNKDERLIFTTPFLKLLRKR